MTTEPSQKEILTYRLSVLSFCHHMWQKDIVYPPFIACSPYHLYPCIFLFYFSFSFLNFTSCSESTVIFSAKFDCLLAVLSRTACACCWKIFLSNVLESVFSASSLSGLAANPVGRKISNLPVQDISKGKNN